MYKYNFRNKPTPNTEPRPVYSLLQLINIIGFGFGFVHTIEFNLCICGQ